jgi:hypothetical protein
MEPALFSFLGQYARKVNERLLGGERRSVFGRQRNLLLGLVDTFDFAMLGDLEHVAVRAVI